MNGLLLEQLETRLREAERSLEALRASADFWASLAHEIRVPLLGIIAYVELLRREEGEKLSWRGREDLEIVCRSANSLLALVNDTLDLARIEGGRMDVAVEAIDLEQIVADCFLTLRELISQKNVQASWSVDASARHVMGDAIKVRRIVLNLLSNAAKFTLHGAIVIDVVRRGSDVAIRVEDSGVGLPTNAIADLFERRVSRSCTGGGAGLGLSIVRELARLLGGDVVVESEEGKGSCFTVTFPAEPASADKSSMTRLTVAESVARKRQKPVGNS
ncbi:MAG TPA: HAMP domain-containing sensor histidine kinase [Polyangiaceae bacterium]|nr:HAMP domain-containing sensor histidine kinase [Polyangiaceae bacterium]